MSFAPLGWGVAAPIPRAKLGWCAGEESLNVTPHTDSHRCFEEQQPQADGAENEHPGQRKSQPAEPEATEEGNPESEPPGETLLGCSHPFGPLPPNQQPTEGHRRRDPVGDRESQGHVNKEDHAKGSKESGIPREHRGHPATKAEQKEQSGRCANGTFVEDRAVDAHHDLAEIGLLGGGGRRVGHGFTIPQGVLEEMGTRGHSRYPVAVNLVELSEPVASALREGRPVVALESTIIAHGLPRPANLEAAREFEELLLERGVTPATIAVVEGVPRAGLSPSQLEHIASDPEVVKASVRDLPMVIQGKKTGATTVASTAHLAALAGIRVFATGGLGGVHQGASETFDESADLPILAETPITVVSAGVKSVLDISATLERLETLSVPVLGFGTDVFPSFWLRESPYPLDWRVDSAQEVADIMAASDRLGARRGILVANPVPENQAWDKESHDRIISQAFAAADAEGIRGKAVTPFLLDYIQRASEGVSLRVNLDVVRNNIRVAGDIAEAFAKLRRA